MVRCQRAGGGGASRERFAVVPQAFLRRFSMRRYWVCNDRSHSDARPIGGESGFRDTTGAYIQ